MKKRLYLGAIALLCFAPLAMAVDVWGGPPPKSEIPEGWNRGDPGSTFQHWDIISPMEWEIPQFENPYGVPVAALDDAAGWEFGEWETPGGFGGWHAIAEGGGSITLNIPNDPSLNEIKYLFIQITSSKGPTDVSVVGSGPSTSYTSGTFSTGRPHILWSQPPAPFGGVWYTYNYGLTIEPNPTSETITVTVPYSTVIDQIVVDTICIPEPGTIGLLALGGLALIRRRRTG